MPLPQSQSFDGFGFGRYSGSSENIVQCQKRKIDIIERAQLEEMYENLDSVNEHIGSIAKRQCKWLSCENQIVDFCQNEAMCEDVNMDEDRDVVPPGERDNTSSDQMLSQCCEEERHEILESSASVDSSPPESHYTSSQTPIRETAPWSISQEKVRRGLKPSPVSNRLYCHCSASWRGMYGLDAGYITDYY